MTQTLSDDVPRRVYSAERLRAARPSGMSRADAARRVGRTEAAVALYETGTCIPAVEDLNRLAAVYGVPPDSLYDPADPADPVVRFAAEMREVVDQAPPLSPRQRAGLRAILRGVADRKGGIAE